RVFQLTDGGLRPYVASYEEMTQDAWCLPGKSAEAARKIVREAMKLGLIERLEQKYVTGGQRPNAYRINWPSVADLARGRPPGHHDREGGHHDREGGHHDRPFKEDTRSFSVLSSSFQSGPEGADRIGEEQIFKDLPELASLRDEPVEPLPSGLKMRADPYAMLKESDFATPARITLWFRHRASLGHPANLAELALILAAAKRVAAMPAAEVQASRRRVFVGLVRRRAWYRVRCHLPDVMHWLDSNEALEALQHEPKAASK
ncbi:MAG: hypothetical protein ACPGWS_00585, partial [Solirubrobacterales bacterium]